MAALVGVPDRRRRCAGLAGPDPDGPPRPARWPARACRWRRWSAGMVITGLAVRLLWPGNWDDLADQLDRGLSAIHTVSWPYCRAAATSVRLVVLLAAPLLGGIAAVLAFWPARRHGALLRGLALVSLLVLYGTAVTEHDLGRPLLRGAVLLLLVAAWLWLPRLAPREAATGTVAVLVVGLPRAASVGRAGRRLAVVGLPLVELVRGRGRRGVRLEPLLWPDDLAARRQDPAQRRDVQAGLPEGRDARPLRRPTMGARRRRRRRATRRRAARAGLQPLGAAPAGDRAGAAQRLRGDHRHAAGDQRRRPGDPQRRRHGGQARRSAREGRVLLGARLRPRAAARGDALGRARERGPGVELLLDRGALHAASRCPRPPRPGRAPPRPVFVPPRGLPGSTAPGTPPASCRSRPTGAAIAWPGA